MSNYYVNLTSNGLTTVSTVVPAANTYAIDGKISISTPSNSGDKSALVVVINKNGSPVYTGTAGSEGFYTTVACAASDTITIVFSSAAAADQGLNKIKSTISISQML